jgi:hypothetical protein
VKIDLSYRFKDEAEVRNVQLEMEEDKVYTFTRAVTFAEKYIQSLHGTWTLEDVIEFSVKLES